MKRFFLVLPVIALVGCSSNTTSFAPVNATSNATVNATSNAVPANTSSTQSADVPAETSPASSTGGAKVPPGMAMSSRMTLTPTPDLDKKIAAAQKGSDKKKLAQAYAERGTFRMNDTSASPKIIYRAALQDYRAALKLDANNQEAKTNKALIESIYKSMGRPIPEA